MQDLLLHSTTRFVLEAYRKQLPQGVLLVGPQGVGKRTIATAWARDVTDRPLYIIEPDEKGSISIETVRQLYLHTRSKSVKQQIFLIDKAETMGLEAQNAFLKLLEEPNSNIVFLLTVTRYETLLPTILSRLQIVRVLPLDAQTLQHFLLQLQPQLTKQALSQLLFIAQGRPGTATKLLQDADFLAQERDHMQQAKQLLAANTYHRYQAINRLTNRNHCLAILNAMLYMSNLQLITSSNETKLQHWLTINTALQQSLERINSNGNLKTQLLKLFASW